VCEPTLRESDTKASHIFVLGESPDEKQRALLRDKCALGSNSLGSCAIDWIPHDVDAIRHDPQFPNNLLSRELRRGQDTRGQLGDSDEE
jgi:hypothetical protein